MKKILIAGASGMVGQLVLRKSLEDPEITEIITPVRTPLSPPHKKITEVIQEDFLNYTEWEKLLTKIDTVYYCVGVYTGTVDRATFRKITIDYPLALAKAIKMHAPKATFVLLSGQGADRKEKSPFAFALDKGIIENKLTRLLGKAFYSCRPGYIYPVTPRQEPAFSYVLSRKIYPLLKFLGKGFSITSEQLAFSLVKIGQEKPELNLFENKDLIDFLES